MSGWQLFCSVVFLAAALIRKRSRHLRALFVPTAVIGGFLALALGPEGVGRFADSNGIFPDQTFAVWHALPGLLINVMSASLLLGEQLPAPRKIWRISGSHVVMAGIMSAGQFAAAGLLVWAVLKPGFDFSDKGGGSLVRSRPARGASFRTCVTPARRSPSPAGSRRRPGRSHVEPPVG